NDMDVIQSEIANAGEFHYVIPTFYGYRPSVLLKGNDTIDIFGNVNELSQSSIVGWACSENEDTILNTAKYDVRRNTSVNYGIKHNPDSDFPSLCSEWTGSNSTSESNFKNFGLHSLDNTISKENIANINFGTEVAENNIVLSDDYYQINNLDTNTYYVAYLVSEDESVVYGYKGFLTKGTTQRTASGTWSDNNWTAGEPTFNDVVEIPSNMDVIVSANTTAMADSLIIREGASFKNNGILNVNNTKIEKTFVGYNNANTTGWYLMGLPIMPSTDNQTYIAECLDAREDNDDIDLYFWKEDYTENDMQGMWANYKVYNSSEPFFEQTKGYLVAYSNDKTNNFIGNINDEDSYTLLSNASLSGTSSDFGWHLVANPYSFSVPVSQLTRNNIALPNTLNTTTGNYITLTSESTIAPFEGFFVQVANATNSLTIDKNTATNNFPRPKIDSLNNNLLSFSIGEIEKEDKFSMAFDSEASFGLDWQTDSHKLMGYGEVAEIFAVFDNENFAMNIIPSQEDTLIIDLRCKIKKQGTYNIIFNSSDIHPYNNVFLFDRMSGEELENLSLTPVYSFEANENMPEDKFLLKFIRNTLNNDTPISSHFINISQNNNNITAYSDENINSLTLYSTEGKQILQTSDNKISIKQKGVFFLNIRTNNNQKTFKIIIL
ncbi:MAG: T9SS type A sorting domain-containing protein, partial [Bacteroidota bacterium]|nr:T9SS type A sorting domain-containing protein [Bacteroidota bacterium]